MFGLGGSDLNSQHDVIAWKDDEGQWWAQAVTAAAASNVGTEPYKTGWSLTGGLKAKIICRH